MDGIRLRGSGKDRKEDSSENGQLLKSLCTYTNSWSFISDLASAVSAESSQEWVIWLFPNIFCQSLLTENVFVKKQAVSTMCMCLCTFLHLAVFSSVLCFCRRVAPLHSEGLNGSSTSSSADSVRIRTKHWLAGVLHTNHFSSAHIQCYESLFVNIIITLIRSQPSIRGDVNRCSRKRLAYALRLCVVCPLL